MDRRRYLATAAAAVTIAGCSNSTTDNSRNESDSESGVTSRTETDAKTPTATRTTDSLPNYDVRRTKKSAVSPSYDEFFRNFESEYQGQSTHFQYAQVYQVIYRDDEQPWDHIQMNVTNTRTEGWQGDIAAWWDGDRRLLEDDMIEVWGVAEDLYTYETVQGDERTIPYLAIVDFEFYGESTRTSRAVTPTED